MYVFSSKMFIPNSHVLNEFVNSFFFYQVNGAAAKASAHPLRQHDDLIHLQAEKVGDDFLHFGRVLGGRVDGELSELAGIHERRLRLARTLADCANIIDARRCGRSTLSRTSRSFVYDASYT